MTKVGSRIRQLRTRTGVSQRDLAAQTEGVVTQSTLSRIEAGKREALTHELVALAWALGCPTDFLLEDEPLEDRVLVATRCLDGADLEAARRDMLELLRMDRWLPEMELARA